MNIIQEQLVCSTYFRTSQVTPFVDSDNNLHVYNGISYQASWGKSQVSSTVKEMAGIVAVKVVGWHKHTISPVGGNFYFVPENGRYVRRTANHKTVKNALKGV